MKFKVEKNILCRKWFIVHAKTNLIKIVKLLKLLKFKASLLNEKQLFKDTKNQTHVVFGLKFFLDLFKAL